MPTSPVQRAIARGKSFERATVRLLRDWLGWEIERNLNQSRKGGNDLTGTVGASKQIDKWAIECKNVARPAITTWWKQAVAQAGSEQFPALAFKTEGTKRQRRWAFWSFHVPKCLNVTIIETKFIKSGGGCISWIVIVNDDDALEVLAYRR